MKEKIKKCLLAFVVALPIAFVLIFFGFLPPQFDVVVYTNNVIGEGTCSSYLTDTSKSFAYVYKADAYFGSELKTLRLFHLPYNVETVTIYLYDVDEAEIASLDLSVFGRTVTHVSKDGLSHPFSKTPETAVISDEEPLVHMVKEADQESLSISFPGSTIIPHYIWIAYGCFILLVAAALAMIIYLVFERLPRLQLLIMSATATMLTMIMGCFLCGSLPYVNYTYFLLNWLLLFALTLFINALTCPCVGTVLVSIFALFWYIANHFVILFRNKPIMPADLKAIRTAKEVAGSYDLTPDWKIVVSVIVLLLYLTIIILVWKKRNAQDNTPLRKKLTLRGASIVTAALFVVLGLNNPAFRNLNTFQWDAKVLEGFHREGIVLTFVKSAISAHVDRPEGYSREIVNAYLSDYQFETKKDAIQPTRVIMVMNEAFSDLRTVGLDEKIDVMPYIDSLDENTVEGSLYVSVLGGGTCNTEFEALTGNSLAFLSPGAYPYTENVTEPLFSLASYFRGEGFVTESFHASSATSWNRNTVYPNMGFDVFHSIDDYPNITSDSYVHNYVADATDYTFIKQRDEQMKGHSRFLFNVTIQNHADYDRFGDVEEAETLKAYGDLNTNVRVYLSLIKLSDDEIQRLVEDYKNSSEPTMIIFFGDHHPSLPAAAQADVYTNMSKYLDFFKSKYFIWTNYDTETQHNTEISANYLPWLILERGNFPLPPYVQMLKELHTKYPVISSQGVIDSEGNVYDNVAVLLDDPLIQKYQYIQYANLFDELDPVWFEVP